MARILIIDDSATEVFVLSRMVRAGGHVALVSQSAEDGLQKARLEKPDVIIMDIVMPGMNGFQATRELSKDPDTASIPVLMVTTKSDETDRVWGLRQGATDYIVKPVTEEQLVTKIKAVLNG